MTLTSNGAADYDSSELNLLKNELDKYITRLLKEKESQSTETSKPRKRELRRSTLSL
jgi:hypothetical protein